jgi:NADH dehydrogenase [ubiquinone] 1 alpha subcomplex assembly factor 1
MWLKPASADWHVIDDGVMGGLSRGRATAEGQSLRFDGDLSLENNGGFSSIRTRLEKPFRHFGALRLTVSGDGRQYQARLRETSEAGDVAWRAFFSAGAERLRLELSARHFQPVIRGEPAIGARPLANASIHFLGFMLTSDEPGPFFLRIHEIELIAAPDSDG